MSRVKRIAAERDREFLEERERQAALAEAQDQPEPAIQDAGL
jgi:hypothetical protein